MKVIKVIVEKLPTSCYQCNFAVDKERGGAECAADNKFRDIRDGGNIPDWCPLIPVETVMKWQHWVDTGEE